MTETTAMNRDVCPFCGTTWKQHHRVPGWDIMAYDCGAEISYKDGDEEVWESLNLCAAGLLGAHLEQALDEAQTMLKALRALRDARRDEGTQGMRWASYGHPVQDTFDRLEEIGAVLAAAQEDLETCR